MKVRTPLPVPEKAPPKSGVLEAGTVKAVFLDREAAAKDEPAWLIYVAADGCVYRAFEWSTKHMAGLNARGRGRKSKPLFPPDHVAYWVETTAAIELYNEETSG